MAANSPGSTQESRIAAALHQPELQNQKIFDKQKEMIVRNALISLQTSGAPKFTIKLANVVVRSSFVNSRNPDSDNSKLR